MYENLREMPVVANSISALNMPAGARPGSSTDRHTFARTGRTVSACSDTSVASTGSVRGWSSPARFSGALERRGDACRLVVRTKSKEIGEILPHTLCVIRPELADPVVSLV